MSSTSSAASAKSSNVPRRGRSGSRSNGVGEPELDAGQSPVDPASPPSSAPSEMAQVLDFMKANFQAVNAKLDRLDGLETRLVALEHYCSAPLAPPVDPQLTTEVTNLTAQVTQTREHVEGHVVASTAQHSTLVTRLDEHVAASTAQHSTLVTRLDAHVAASAAQHSTLVSQNFEINCIIE